MEGTATEARGVAIPQHSSSSSSSSSSNPPTPLPQLDQQLVFRPGLSRALLVAVAGVEKVGAEEEEEEEEVAEEEGAAGEEEEGHLQAGEEGAEVPGVELQAITPPRFRVSPGQTHSPILPGPTPFQLRRLLLPLPLLLRLRLRLRLETRAPDRRGGQLYGRAYRLIFF